jgi:hypothetical protein
MAARKSHAGARRFDGFSFNFYDYVRFRVVTSGGFTPTCFTFTPVGACGSRAMSRPANVQRDADILEIAVPGAGLTVPGPIADRIGRGRGADTLNALGSVGFFFEGQLLVLVVRSWLALLGLWILERHFLVHRPEWPRAARSRIAECGVV